MGKKKKRPRKNQAEGFAEANEELLALSAIYGGSASNGMLTVHDDNRGWTMRVVPHPGDFEANHVSVELFVRYTAKS